MSYIIDEDINEITEHLYLSNWYTGNNFNILQKFNIKAIITIDNYPKPPEVLEYYKENNIDYMFINLTDEPSSNLYNYFNITYHFIKDRITTKQNVLVHCHAGISRSATIVLNYLIRCYYYNKTIVNTHPIDIVNYNIEQVRKRRPMIDPNIGFRAQLLRKAIEYDNEHHKETYIPGI